VDTAKVSWWKLTCAHEDFVDQLHPRVAKKETNTRDVDEKSCHIMPCCFHSLVLVRDQRQLSLKC
jgi:hypothetical protein